MIHAPDVADAAPLAASGWRGWRAPFGSRLLGRAVWLLALLHLALQIGVFLPRNLTRTDRDRDLVNYYLPARAALQHQPLYEPQPGFGPDRTLFIYIYLPPFAAAVAPLGLLPFVTFARVWLLLLFAATGVYAWCLARLAVGKGANWRHGIVAFLAIGVCPGTLYALALGESDPLLWMLLGLALLDIAPGVTLACAALTKMFFGWPLLVLSCARRQLLRPALLTLGIALLLGLIVCGASSYQAWAREILPLLGQGTFNPQNVSLSMGALRVAPLFGWDYAGGPLGTGPKLWLSLASFAGPLLMWRAARRLESHERAAWVMLAATLCAPTCWINYLPLALAPLALWLRRVAIS